MITIEVRPDSRGGWSVRESDGCRPWLRDHDRDAGELIALYRARGRAADVQLFTADGTLERFIELRPERAETLGTRAAT